MSKIVRDNSGCLVVTMIAPAGGMAVDALDRIRTVAGKVAIHNCSPIWAVGEAVKGNCGSALVILEWVYRDGCDIAMVLEADPSERTTVIGGGYGVSGSELADRHLPDGENWEYVATSLDATFAHSAGDVLRYLGQTCEPRAGESENADPLPAGAWTEYDPR